MSKNGCDQNFQKHYCDKKLYQMLNMWELDKMGFIQLIVYTLLRENVAVLGSRQVFDEKIS